MLEHVRGEDIACRMGGEELVVILPDCPCETAVARAEELRTLVRNLAVEFQGRPSAGSPSRSAWPPSRPTGRDRGPLLAADAALNSAKAQGRDRTLVHAP